MIKITDFKRIVFYGCSFTVGSELSDLELFPNLTQAQIDKIKIKEGYSFYNAVDPVSRDTLDNQKSWTRWFSDELGLPWENRASGGSSMGQIIFNIESDLITGRILDNDLVIVGITSPDRLCRFTKLGPNSLILNNLDVRWEDESFRNKFITYIASDGYILYNWYKDINYIDLLSNKLQGRLLQQFVWANMEEIFQFNTNSKPHYMISEYMTKIVNRNVKFDSIIDKDLSFTTLNGWAPENKHAFNHPKLKLHQAFGKQIAKTFKEKYS